MMRRFLEDNSFLTVLVFFNQVLWFLFKLILLWQFSDQDYSFFLVSVSALLTLQFFGHLNLYKSMSISISKEVDQNTISVKNQEVIKSHFMVVTIFTLVASLFLFLLIFLSSQNIVISVLFGLDLLLENIILFFYFIFIGLGLIKKAGLVFISSNFLRLCLISVFYFILNMPSQNISLELVIGIYTLSSLFTVVLCSVLVYNQFNEIPYPKEIKKSEFISNLIIIRKGIFLTLISIIIQLYSTLLYFFIREFDISSVKEADVALMFLSFILIFYSLTSLLTSVNPEILSNARIFIEKFFAPLTISSVLFAGITLILINLNSPITQVLEIISLSIFNLNYWNLNPFLTIAIFGVPFQTMYMMIMGFFVGNNKSKFQFYFNLSAFLFSLPLLYIFSHNFGALGSLLSYTIFSIFLAIFSILGFFYHIRFEKIDLEPYVIIKKTLANFLEKIR
ncbi:MAG: hypothetical protein ACXAB2_00275 [Candidatus Hodarchaeales archaeon]|jgi:hypothetical protein